MLSFKKFITKRLSFILLLVIFLASTWSLYSNQFFRVHDYTHGARIAEMANSLKEGHFPVRWSANFGFGFGMPLFNFYAPLPYYIASIFFILGFDLVLTIKLALYLLPNFLTLLGSYKLGKKILGRWGGIILAAAFTLAPYRAVNLFVRGALSEIWAMAFLPWVIYAIFNLLENLKTKKNSKRNYLLLILSLAGIILSHNLTALMFIPLSALIAFVLYLRANNYQIKKTISSIWPVALAYLLAFLITAFYVLPSFLEKDFTKINFIFSGYFEYHHHFLYIRQFFQENWTYGGSAWGPDDDMSFFLGWGQIFALLSLSGLFIFTTYQNKSKIKTIIKQKQFFYTFIFGIFALFALFMAILKSKFLWDKIGFLQFIQFPWRWLTVATLFVAILAALSTLYFKKAVWRYLYGLLLILLVLLNAMYFRPEKFLDNNEALYYSDPKRIQQEMSSVLPDYIPSQMAKEKVLDQVNKQENIIWLDDDSVIIKNFDFHVDRGHEKLVELELSDSALVNFKVAYFPGWQAEIDGQPSPITTNAKLGNIQVLVPKGSYKVGIYLSEKTLARTLGNALSIIGWVIFFLYFSPFVDLEKKVKSRKKN